VYKVQSIMIDGLVLTAVKNGADNYGLVTK